MSGHAQYSPSRLKQIMACPGCVQLERIARAQNRTVDEQSPAAAEGSMLHEVMEDILNSHGSITTYPDSDTVKTATEHLDDEQRHLINSALAYLYDSMSSYAPSQIIHWATEAEASMEGFGVPEIHGTTDVVILTSKSGDHQQDAKLHIFDWKFGRYGVNAKDNPQLLAYGHGVYASMCDSYEQRYIYPSMPMALHIVQPRVENYQRWETHISTDWVTSCRAVITDAESSNPTYVPSDETCRWCACKSLCGAYLSQVQTNATQVFATLNQNPDMWTEDQVQFLLGQLQALQKVSEGILETYENRLKEGKPVPGFKLVQGQGRRVWKNFNDVIEYFDSHHPEVEVFASKPMSPAALEKKIPLADRRSTDFMSLIDKVHGVKMVPSSEGGEEIKRGVAAAQEAFKEFI